MKNRKDVSTRVEERASGFGYRASASQGFRRS